MLLIRFKASRACAAGKRFDGGEAMTACADAAVVVAVKETEVAVAVEVAVGGCTSGAGAGGPLTPRNKGSGASV